MRDGFYLSDQQMWLKALCIAESLHNVPMSQIEPLLKKARDIALASGEVNIHNARFSELRKEFSTCSAESA